MSDVTIDGPDHTAFFNLTLHDAHPPETANAPDTSVSTGAHQGSKATGASDDEYIAQARENVNDLADQWSRTLNIEDFSNYDKARADYIATLNAAQHNGSLKEYKAQLPWRREQRVPEIFDAFIKQTLTGIALSDELRTDLMQQFANLGDATGLTLSPYLMMRLANACRAVNETGWWDELMWRLFHRLLTIIPMFKASITWLSW